VQGKAASASSEAVQGKAASAASGGSRYWRAEAHRFGSRGGLTNPRVIWHSALAKAKREGWESEFRRLNKKP